MTPLEPTDEQLAAWLAGDLDDPEDMAVTRAVETDPSVASRADALSTALLRLDVGVAEPPTAGFDARLDAALAARLGLGPAAAAAAAVAPPQADTGAGQLPAADRPRRPRPGGRRPRPVWRRGPATRTAHPGQRRIDRLVPGLAVLLLMMVVTTVGIRSFRDGPLPAARPTADEQTDVLGTDKPPTEIPLAAADPTDPSGGDVDAADPTDDPSIQATGPGASSDGDDDGSAGPSGDDTGSDVALGGGSGSGASGGETALTPDSGAGSAGGGAAAGDPPADSPATDGPATDGPATDGPATDGPATDDPVAEDPPTSGGDQGTDGADAPEPSPTTADPAPEEDADGQGGGPDEGAGGGSGEEVAAGDGPPPEGQPESQPEDEAADEPPTAAGPESGPEGDGPSSPTIADSQAALPDPAAVEQHFGHRPESAAVLGLSGQEAADRAEQHAEEVRQAPPFSSGEVPDRCLGVALQGSTTAVVVAVETVTYDGQAGLAYLVVRGDPLDRADVTIVPAGSCEPLLLQSVPA